ncbi:hypothetical protein DUNSADRAFT_15954 [Dunaliella salina]|uniref:Uncharacterized protein n=1 Tax=Dunaliella salina TaxID=3046 RepID=A0ABQ7G4L0_DUNSA|nr:hypothetical protein DUNSADRAFT_15954 [Dunaliella salina]|eukprot:KAF5829537.1 hypothetical protein DUNSADRAFT_15954 [Dunaliella salina]
MSALYGCLEGLPNFRSLRALELNTVIFDCDYSLCIFAELTALTSLRMCYQTWPLSLGHEDLKLLAPLQNLRELKLLAHPQEEHQLLALTNGVLETWRVSFGHLTCLHFSGLIVFSDNCAPELARFSSLMDLSLTATADVAYQQDISYFLSQGPAERADEPEECSKSASTRAESGEVKGKNGDNRIGEFRRRQGFRHRAAKGALYLGWSLGPRSLPDLHVPSSIPPTLSKLALSGFALCMRDYSYIASLPGLSHLQLSHPGLHPEHLLLTNTSSLTRSLEHLVLNSPAAPFESMQRYFDRRPAVPPWRLWCHQGSSETHTSHSSTDDDSTPFTKVTRKSSSTDSTASHASSTSAGNVGSGAELQNESLVDQVPWWVDHEASLIALALAQLGQLQALKHLQINVPCQSLSSKTTTEPPSLTTAKRQCTWSRESVVAALGDEATQLRSLRVLPRA